MNAAVAVIIAMIAAFAGKGRPMTEPGTGYIPPPKPEPGNILIPPDPVTPDPIPPIPPIPPQTPTEYPIPSQPPEDKMEIPEPPTDSLYQSWNAYYDAVMVAYNWNYSLDAAYAKAHGLPIPPYIKPFTDQERLDKLNSLQPMGAYSGHIYTDKEIQAYADKWGLSFLSAKTAISQGMFDA